MNTTKPPTSVEIWRVENAMRQLQAAVELHDDSPTERSQVYWKSLCRAAAEELRKALGQE